MLSGRIASSLAGKRILITGAGGCIGSAVAKSVARSGARELILVDSSESVLYDVQQALMEGTGDLPPLFPILASVCDSEAIFSLFAQHRPEIVFHAAAFKHVPLMESNPFSVVANNVFGTHILASATAQNGCEQMLMISTDKAVDPSSIMGASKRIAEHILLTQRPDAVCRKVVRLGNVLGSSGSVVPLFRRQIASGVPVTVAHPEVSRYFMTLSEAVNALLLALASSTPTGLFVPPLADPIRILDLAKYLIARKSSENSEDPDNEVQIVFTGLRPGDKMKESLISSRESYRSAADGTLREVQTPTLSPNELSAALNDLRTASHMRNLSALLRAVRSLVPEYQPSAQLREQAQAAVTVNV
jgi:FlaA1/EpsC-like NDP-sugar epimerase